MKYSDVFRLPALPVLIFLAIFFTVACRENSSPEGRMNLKIESLQREMLDSLTKQNRAILDSLGKIREELKQVRQLRR
jgi:hypothetical protein